MPDRLGHLRARVGRRGTILLILAFIDFAFGGSLIFPTAASRIAPAAVWRDHYAPTWMWGVAWMIVGAVLIVSAFMTNDEVGYTAAISLKIAWSLTALASWFLGGVERGWLSAAVWLVVSAMVYVISGWPEHGSPPPLIDEGS